MKKNVKLLKIVDKKFLERKSRYLIVTPRISFFLRKQKTRKTDEQTACLNVQFLFRHGPWM